MRVTETYCTNSDIVAIKGMFQPRCEDDGMLTKCEQAFLQGVLLIQSL